MLEEVEAEYYMFSDQDDYWLPTKTEESFMTMKELEAANRPGLPVLVHTDLRVVDEQLRELHPSFLAYQGIRIERYNKFSDYVMGNPVTGNTMLFNRPAKQAALSHGTNRAFMHDNGSQYEWPPRKA